MAKVIVYVADINFIVDFRVILTCINKYQKKSAIIANIIHHPFLFNDGIKEYILRMQWICMCLSQIVNL